MLYNSYEHKYLLTLCHPWDNSQSVTSKVEKT